MNRTGIKIIDRDVYDEHGKVDATATVFEIKNEYGFITGCHSKKKNIIYVWAVESNKKGFLKESMNKITKFFKCTNVEFTNIITPDLITKLHGFKVVKRYFKGEEIVDLVGEWKEGGV